MQKRNPARNTSPPRPPGGEQEPGQSEGRHRPAEEEGAVRSVRLTRKYAEMIDGVDLADAHVGDELKLPTHDADMLIAEGWAEPTSDRRGGRRATDAQFSTPERRGGGKGSGH